MLITWLLYRIIKICGCRFQRCFSKIVHLTLLDTILSLIIFVIEALVKTRGAQHFWNKIPQLNMDL